MTANYVRIAFVVFVTIAGLAIISWLFGRHFITDLIRGPRGEFRTRAGKFSFVGFLAFIYLILHKEAMGYLVWLSSPENEQVRILEHAERSQDTLIWGAIVTLLGNFVLLGVLGLIGGRGRKGEGAKPRKR